MKKLLYVCRYALEEKQTLKAKFNGQFKGFSELGFDVYHLAFDKHLFYLVHNGQKETIGKTFLGKKSFYLHTFAYINLYQNAIKALKKVKFDVLYVRHDPMDFFALAMFKLAKKQGVKTICEVPTYPLYQSKVENPLFHLGLKLADIVAKRCAKFIDVFALIGEKASTFNGKPAMNIGNGVDVLSYALRDPNSNKDGVHLLGIAAMSDWQGFDRAILGIKAYQGQTPITLHLVGDEGDGSLAKWQNLVENLGLTKRVHFYPSAYGDELNDLVNLADVGLSPLGQHRNNLFNSFSLKVREYMSRGLPIVLGVNDDDINDQLPFICRVPSDDSPLNMQRIVDFAQGLQHHQNIPATMRAYAQTHMSWAVQLNKVLSYVDENVVK